MSTKQKAKWLLGLSFNLCNKCGMLFHRFVLRKYSARCATYYHLNLLLTADSLVYKKIRASLGGSLVIP